MYRPDVVHTHNLPGISTGIWETCRRLGRPVVHTLHDYQLLCPRTSLMRTNGEPCPRGLLCGSVPAHLVGAGRVTCSGVSPRSSSMLTEPSSPTPSAQAYPASCGADGHEAADAARRPVAPARLHRIGARDQGCSRAAAAPELAEIGVTVTIAGKGRFWRRRPRLRTDARDRVRRVCGGVGEG